MFQQLQNLPRLYARGRHYTDRLSRLVETGLPRAVAVRRLAAEVRRPRKDVRAALAFTAAVEHISACAGIDAGSHLLSSRSSLTTKAVMTISRTHPDRIRYAVSNVRRGRSPFAPPPAGTDPPFDTLDYGEVVSRFARAAGLIDLVARSDVRVLNEFDADRVGRHVSEIRRHCAAVASCFGEMSLPGSDGGSIAAPARRTHAVTEAERFLAAAAGLVRKNGRDIVRLVSEQPPSPGHAVAVLAAIDRVRAAGERLATARRGLVREAPEPEHGTYVVVFHLPAPLPGHVVGRLGTFDFPAGYYCYVGSAFGGGGVRARTSRHLTPDTVKKWNVDYLKDRAVPVEVWWTCDGVRRECAWSAAVSSLPGVTAPAPGFGSNDCTTCPAHLYHAECLPSFRRFEEAVLGVAGHAPVFRTAVPFTTGRRAQGSEAGALGSA